jgi:hypothetical protein
MAMLNSLKDEQRQLQTRLETIKEREETLKAWLAEEQPAPEQRQLEIAASVAGYTPLSGFLRGVLADGRPHTLKEIVARAKERQGLLRENVMPGRAIHFALLSLQQHGYARRTKDGTWVTDK